MNVVIVQHGVTQGGELKCEYEFPISGNQNEERLQQRTEAS